MVRLGVHRSFPPGACFAARGWKRCRSSIARAGSRVRVRGSSTVLARDHDLVGVGQWLKSRLVLYRIRDTRLPPPARAANFAS